MILIPRIQGGFPTVTLDPPWDGEEMGCRGYAGVKGFDVNAGSQYNVMSLAEIESFGREALDRCQGSVHHWMWTTDLFLHPALELIAKWGLQRKRTFIWVKTTEQIRRTQKGLREFGRDQIETAGKVMQAIGIPGKPNSKTGYWSKMGHEYLIFSTNDSSRRLLNAKFEPSVFFAPVPGGVHSAKPPEAYEIIRRNSQGPRLACFERDHRPGFVCHGDQLAVQA